MWFQKPPLGTSLDWGNPLNDGTVLALAVNEGYGDKVQDLSLNGNHGTLNNFAFPPTVDSGWNPGQTGIGLNFDSVDDYINCGNNASLDITDSITYGAIAMQVPATNGFLMCKNTNADTKRLLGIYLCGTTDTVYVFYHDGAKKSVTWPYNCDDGEYHVYTVSIDGVTTTLYIDGVSHGDQTLDGAFQIDNTANLYIGCRAVETTLLRGNIDQPRIHSRAWSAKEARDYAINPWQVYLDE